MKRSLPDARVHGRATCKWIGTLSMAWGLLLSVMVIGCAGSLDPGIVGGGGASGGMGGSSGNGCEVTIFADQCAGCHGTGTSGSAGLDLTSPNPETRMLGKMGGTTNTGVCSTMTLLVKGSVPATGVFVDKITMMTPPCGTSMPYGSLPNGPDTACLISWANRVAAAP